MKKKWMELERKIDKSTIIMGDFNIALSITDQGDKNSKAAKN